MFCQDCGNELPDHFQFCNKCGVKIILIEQPPSSDRDMNKQGAVSIGVGKKPKAKVKIAIGCIALLFLAFIALGTIGYFMEEGVKKQVLSLEQNYKIGKKAFQERDYEKAIANLQLVAKEDKKYESTLYLLALSYGSKNDFIPAITCLQNIPKEHPTYEKAQQKITSYIETIEKREKKASTNKPSDEECAIFLSLIREMKRLTSQMPEETLSGISEKELIRQVDLVVLKTVSMEFKTSPQKVKMIHDKVAKHQLAQSYVVCQQ